MRNGGHVRITTDARTGNDNLFNLSCVLGLRSRLLRLRPSGSGHGDHPGEDRRSEQMITLQLHYG